MHNQEDQIEPLTPLSRLFIRPENNHVIYCAIGLKNPININILKNEFSNSIITKIPRFSSLLVMNPITQTQEWQHVNFDDHIFVHHKREQDFMSRDDFVNSHLAELAMSTSPMSLNKPLWEIHVMQEQSYLMFKVHHALADGTSLMSLLSSLGRSGDGDDNITKIDQNYEENGVKKKNVIRVLWESLVFVWHVLVFLCTVVLKCLLVKDNLKGISGIDGIEFWPREVVTARFKLSNIKAIKAAIPNATVHDVLYAILWCGLATYLKVRCPQALQVGTRISGFCPAELRDKKGIQDVSAMLTKTSRSPWGNKFATYYLPIRHVEFELDPLKCVSQCKTIMDQKKLIGEVYLFHKTRSLTSTIFGYKVLSFIYQKLYHNTTFFITNIAGPQKEISIAGNPVDFMRITSSSLPQAITMHFVSYAGWVDMQIQVAKDVIDDPKFLAKCFQDALNKMQIAAERIK